MKTLVYARLEFAFASCLCFLPWLVLPWLFGSTFKRHIAKCTLSKCTRQSAHIVNYTRSKVRIVNYTRQSAHCQSARGKVHKVHIVKVHKVHKVHIVKVRAA